MNKETQEMVDREVAKFNAAIATMPAANRNMRPEEVKRWWEENGEHEYLGATRCYPQDRYPLWVMGVSKSAKTIYYTPVRSVDATTGHEPARYDGPFPVWDHDYTQDEIVRFADNSNPDLARPARWSEKRNCYIDNGTPVKVGVANYHRNYSY